MARAVIEAEPAAKPASVELRHATTLEPIERVDQPAVLLVAVWLGGVRLIDNVVIASD